MLKLLSNKTKFIIFLAFSCLIITSNYITTSAKSSDLTVHFIDVGEGDCILMTCNGQAVMVDYGVARDGKKERLLAYLKSQGIKKIKYAIATHDHGDHMGALDYIMHNIPIHKIMLARYDNTEPFYLRTLRNIKKLKIPVRRPKPGSVFYCGKAKIKVLGPLGNKYKEENDYSLVMKVTYGKISFMLTGDAEKKSEKELVKKYGRSLRSTILKVSHHGYYKATTEAFLKAVSPSCAIISVGPNKIGNPHKSVLRRLKRHHVKVKRTDKLGTIVVSTNGKKLFWKRTKKTTVSK